MSIKYLETNSTNPYYNLAFEEYVLKNKRQGDYLILWQNENTIVIGQNQNTPEEINQEFVTEHNINVVRRTTGGGAVYHDLGNLNYSFISDTGDIESVSMAKFSEPVLKALKGLGLNAELAGRNDILIDGRKISGVAQRIDKERILHHGTLLFNSNPELIAEALNADPSKFQSKSTKSVKSRVGNIKDFLDCEMDLRGFWDYLKKTFSGEGMIQEKLGSEELEQVKALQQSKYDTWEWNFGYRKECNIKNKRRWEGGTLEVRIFLEHGYIKDIEYFGDFLSTYSMEPVISAVKGIPYERDAANKVMENLPIMGCFGKITKDEVLDTMFNI